MHQQVFETLNLDKRWVAWFVGFIDGEGSFLMQRKPGEQGFTFTFKVDLRDDDRGVLEDIRDALNVGHIREKKAYGPRKPQVRYEVSKRNDLLTVICPIFDEYPLRSKKRRDYKIWREALTVASATGRSRAKFEQLSELARKLRDVRKYI